MNADVNVTAFDNVCHHGRPILVSACLAGVPCRYDGATRPHPRVLELVRQGRALPVCPEQLGGLPTPRRPCEISQGRVLTPEGDDLSEAFERGAAEALRLAELAGCCEAWLMARSPSCGVDRVYDGEFVGRLIDGDGVLAGALRAAGIEVHALEPEPAAEVAV